MVDLSIIVVSYNTRELLRACIKSILRYTQGVKFEIIVVDNGSQDNSAKVVKNYRRVVLLENKKNHGFSKANNQGIKVSQGRYILLLNSDTELVENSLEKMIDWMDAHQSAGVATCRLKNLNGSTQATGGYFPNLVRVFLWSTFLDDLPFINILGSYHPYTGGIFGDYYARERKLDWVTGAFFLIRREVIDKVGILDEDFFMYVEEIEYCYRIKKAKWKIFYTPITQIIHIGGASGIRENSILGEFKNLKLFYAKHKSVPEFMLLVAFLKIAAALRIVVLGLFLGRKEVIKVYAKVLV